MIFLGTTLPTTCTSDIVQGSVSVTIKIPNTFESGTTFCGLTASNSLITGSCGTNVNYIIDGTALYIYGEGDMKNYNQYASVFNSYRDTITTIEIAEGVTSIGTYAFCSCSSLSSVNIPNSITTLENGIFFVSKNLFFEPMFLKML